MDIPFLRTDPEQQQLNQSEMTGATAGGIAGTLAGQAAAPFMDKRYENRLREEGVNLTQKKDQAKKDWKVLTDLQRGKISLDDFEGRERDFYERKLHEEADEIRNAIRNPKAFREGMEDLGKGSVYNMPGKKQRRWQRAAQQVGDAAQETADVFETPYARRGVKSKVMHPLRHRPSSILGVGGAIGGATLFHHLTQKEMDRQKAENPKEAQLMDFFTQRAMEKEAGAFSVAGKATKSLFNNGTKRNVNAAKKSGQGVGKAKAKRAATLGGLGTAAVGGTAAYQGAQEVKKNNQQSNPYNPNYGKTAAPADNFFEKMARTIQEDGQVVPDDEVGANQSYEQLAAQAAEEYSAAVQQAQELEQRCMELEELAQQEAQAEQLENAPATENQMPPAEDNDGIEDMEEEDGEEAGPGAKGVSHAQAGENKTASFFALKAMEK